MHRVLIEDVVLANNRSNGLRAADNANVTLSNSQVSGNGDDGLEVWGSAQVSLSNSTVSGNGHTGLVVWWGSAVEVQRSTLEGNGTASYCQKADEICNGITLRGKAQLALSDSIIRANTDWGVAAELTTCGYKYNDFTGKIVFRGNNTIEGNNKSGNQSGKGNPGNHPFKNLPDGQVCLP